MTDFEYLEYLLSLLEQTDDSADDSDEDSGWIEIAPGVRMHG